MAASTQSFWHLITSVDQDLNYNSPYSKNLILFNELFRKWEGYLGKFGQACIAQNTMVIFALCQRIRLETDAFNGFQNFVLTGTIYHPLGFKVQVTFCNSLLFIYLFTISSMNIDVGNIHLLRFSWDYKVTVRNSSISVLEWINNYLTQSGYDMSGSSLNI